MTTMIQRFNQLSGFVATEIIREEDLKARRKVLKFFMYAEYQSNYALDERGGGQEGGIGACWCSVLRCIDGRGSWCYPF